jgi:hypothetical protein
MNWAKFFSGWMTVLMLAALPASSNFKLNSYGFGTGGVGDSSSNNYKINGIAGDVSGRAASSNYVAGAGETYAKQANAPLATITNDASWYNKLKVVIDAQGNPSDAVFAVAISPDNFTTTLYVKNDFTVTPTLTFADYQTYAAWGSGTGQIIRGLNSGTTYTVKAKAYRGKYTESGYGPTTSAATLNPQLSFDIDVAATDISTSPPYQISFGSLPVSTVTDSTNLVWVSLDTNAESGGKVYLSGKNSGLKSTESTYTIAAQTGDLASLPEGFGAQGASATQSSGGPFTLTAPYDGTAANVGIADAVIREIFSSNLPVTAARGSFLLKAKTQPLTPASGDYTETLTAVASAGF